MVEWTYERHDGFAITVRRRRPDRDDFGVMEDAGLPVFASKREAIVAAIKMCRADRVAIERTLQRLERLYARHELALDAKKPRLATFHYRSRR